MIDVEDLQRSQLLAACPHMDLDRLVAQSNEVTLEPGELLFSEDDTADAVWVLLDGALVISKRADGDELMVDHLAPGAFLGEISLLTASPAQHRARAEGPARLLRIPSNAFFELLQSCTQVAHSVLRTMAERVRRIEHLLQQRERMAGLGTLAAGLAHELNNPASAAQRSLGVLGEQLAALKPLAVELARRSWTGEELDALRALAQTTDAPPAPAPADALELADREDALAAWLEDRGVPDGATLAPCLAERGMTVDALADLARASDPAALAIALQWTQRVSAVRQLVREAGASTTRISEIVRAVKAYAHIDVSSLRLADVNEELVNSLTMLNYKLRHANASVVKDLDPALPRVQAYGTELHQVWTNLLDNAADAVCEHGGTIRVRTYREGEKVVVEIADTGPGIAPEIRDRIFDPFFTTKEAGRGTGLGLEIVQRIVNRHHGAIALTSRPGATQFTVRLPATQPVPSISLRGAQPATEATL